MIVKNTSCPSCGGQKMTPSETFYVYCDYCGSLMDLDFTVFLKDLENKPKWNSKDEIRFSELTEELKEAENTENKEAYINIKREWITIQMRNEPKAYPPRIKDEKYKENYLEWLIATDVENAFNPKMKALNGEILERVNLFRYSTVSENEEIKKTLSVEEIMRISKEIEDGNMENIHLLHSSITQIYSGAKTKQIIESETFWAFFKTMMDSVEKINSHHSDLSIQCPDKNTSSGFNTRLTAIAIVQGYIPWLDKKDIDKLIKESGLSGKYHDMPEPKMSERHCGGCGSSVFIVNGAKSVLCQGCGSLIDVNQTEFPCTGCGTHISFPIGEKEVKCTLCQSMIVKI